MDEVPSPNVQFQDVAFATVELKFISNGAHPEVSLDVNEGTSDEPILI